MIRSTKEKCGSRRAYLVVMPSNLFKCRESISGQHFCPLHDKHNPISTDPHKRTRKMINYTFIFQLTMKAINSSYQSRQLQIGMDQIKPVNVIFSFLRVPMSKRCDIGTGTKYCTAPNLLKSLLFINIWSPQNFFFLTQWPSQEEFWVCPCWYLKDKLQCVILNQVHYYIEFYQLSLLFNIKNCQKGLQLVEVVLI